MLSKAVGHLLQAARHQTSLLQVPLQGEAAPAPAATASSFHVAICELPHSTPGGTKERAMVLRSFRQVPSMQGCICLDHAAQTEGCGRPAQTVKPGLAPVPFASCGCTCQGMAPACLGSVQHYPSLERRLHTRLSPRMPTLRWMPGGIPPCPPCMPLPLREQVADRDN